MDDIFWISIIVFVALGSFSLGMNHQRKINLDENPLKIEQDTYIIDAWKEYIQTKKSSAEFFASKNGTVYYPIACPSGNKIKEENRIYFNTTNEAQGAGYKQSSRCN